MVLSSAIAIADDRRSVFPYDRKRSQTYCDLRSAIIWKPALRSVRQGLVFNNVSNVHCNVSTSDIKRCLRERHSEPEFSLCEVITEFFCALEGYVSELHSCVHCKQ